ncbi:MAG: hypothetical protein ACJ8H8_10795 [Geminicoccaceae bacterium]
MPSEAGHRERVRLTLPYRIVPGGFQGRHVNATQALEIVAGPGQDWHVVPGRPVQRPGQHLREQLTRHVEQTMEIHVQAMELRGPADSQIA